MSLIGLLLLVAATMAAGKEDRSHLLLNYISPTAMSIAIGAVVTLLAGLAAACYFDFKGRRGLPKSSRLHEKSVWLPRECQIRQVVAAALPQENKSDDEPSTAVQIGDLQQEAATQHSRFEGVSSHLDVQEKHNRIIEAIYQASGRDIPDEYKSKMGPVDVKLGQKELDKMAHPFEAIMEENDEDLFERTQRSEKTKKRKKETSKEEEAAEEIKPTDTVLTVKIGDATATAIIEVKKSDEKDKKVEKEKEEKKKALDDEDKKPEVKKKSPDRTTEIKKDETETTEKSDKVDEKSEKK